MVLSSTRTAGFLCLLLALLCAGCTRKKLPLHPAIGQNPHLAATSLEDLEAQAAISPASELEAVKREIRRHCHFRHDLDPTKDTPSNGRISDKAYERCYQLKVKGRDIQRGIDRMRELSQGAGGQGSLTLDQEFKLWLLENGLPWPYAYPFIDRYENGLDGEEDAEEKEEPQRVRIGDGPMEVIKQELVTKQNAASTLVLLLFLFVVMLFRRGKQWALPFTDDKNDPFAQELAASPTPPQPGGLWIYRILRTISRFFSFVAFACFPWSLVIVPILLLIDGRWAWALAAAAVFYLAPFILTFFAKLFDRSAVDALLKSTGAAEGEFDEDYQIRALAWNDLVPDREREHSDS